MELRIGIVSTAHMHAYGYAAGLAHSKVGKLTAVWDDDEARGRAFADKYGATFFSSEDELLGQVDGVVICSENVHHIDHLERAVRAGKPVMCEKPIVPNADHGARLKALIETPGAKIMTAFPCRYSPAFKRLVERVRAGEIGKIQAICATNRGRSPGGWFTVPSLSGGGAMIDHVVHVTDLLRVLLESEVTSVNAQIGNNMYGQEWDDTAMVTMEFANGVFATLDSSWSRPQNYKTWGDVTMNVVGELGMIEIDLFGQQFETYSVSNSRFSVAGYGSDIDSGLVQDFLRVVAGEIEPPISAVDGWRAAEVAIKGYESAKRAEPVAVA